MDLEQNIMSCWNVVEDLDVALRATMDRPTPLTEDELANLLLGLRTLYSLRFEELFKAFEHNLAWVKGTIIRSRDSGEFYRLETERMKGWSIVPVNPEQKGGGFYSFRDLRRYYEKVNAR